MVFCKLIHADAVEGMQTLEDGSIDLVITSPPYNVGKEYEVDVSGKEYTDMVLSVCEEWKRVLADDGRFCCNIPFTMGSNSLIRLVLYEWETALLKSGLTIRDCIIWNQNNSGNDTSWGSFKSASCPWIRHQCELIVIGYNKQWKKIHKGESTISNRDFTRWTLDKWDMACARNPIHPAVFPEELPTRCIHLFSYKNDVILDPFVGSGTTMKTAKNLQRNVIGIDKEKKYCDMIRNSSWFYQSSIDNSVEYIYEDIEAIG